MSRDFYVFISDAPAGKLAELALTKTKAKGSPFTVVPKAYSYLISGQPFSLQGPMHAKIVVTRYVTTLTLVPVKLSIAKMCMPSGDVGS